MKISTDFFKKIFLWKKDDEQEWLMFINSFSQKHLQNFLVFYFLTFKAPKSALSLKLC